MNTHSMGLFFIRGFRFKIQLEKCDAFMLYIIGSLMTGLSHCSIV